MHKNQLLKSLMAIVLGLFAGFLLMLSMGYNPIDGYTYLFKGGLMNTQRIGNSIATATPLILTGLSVAFANRTGLFNIGTPGQMLAGGFTVTAIGILVDLPSPVLIPLMVICGIMAGALWAAIPGVLKALFKVNEVVSSIMMNWTAYWIVYYMVPQYLKGTTETESAKLAQGATLKSEWLSKMFGGSYINLGILLAIISVVIIWLILNKTVLGYELKAVGYNKFGAEYAGMPVNRNIVVSMMIAGALAGLAGVVGIAVSLLGNNSPFGVLLSALFFGVLYVGKGFMNANVKVPPELADTIIATIIYFAATSMIMDKVINKFKKIKEEKKKVIAGKTTERAVEK